MKLSMSLLFVLLLVIVAAEVSADVRTLSPFDEASLEIRYGSTTAWLEQEQSTDATSGSNEEKSYAYKSPGKAFALSVLVPGLGQYYYGSRVKPWLFFGAEVTAWVLYFKWNGDYNDLTTAYEQFQRANWSRDDYQRYLLAAYGVEDDDSVSAVEVSHHLPDTETGQYFEMTGKYNQFAWGWDDATRDGQPLEYWETNNSDIAITDPSKTPLSANRATYVDMRDEANKKYDQARAMIFVSLANRLISGFEAFLTTKHRNKYAAGHGDTDFSLLDLRASMRTYNSPNDTPFLSATVRF